MTNINVANQSVGEAGGVSPSESSVHGVMVTLGGDMVQEYDQQIANYNAELVKLNVDRSEARDDKNTVNSLKDNQTPGGIEGYLIGDLSAEDKEKIFYEVDPKVAIKYEEMAEKYGVSIDVKATKNGDRAFISTEDMESIAGAAESKEEDLNSQSELKMIKFQSVMDARKQAMLMLSNMVNSENSTKMSIIQNFK